MVVCGTKSKQSLCEPSCNGNIPAASPSPMNKNQVHHYLSTIFITNVNYLVNKQ